MYANYTQDLMLQKYRWVSTQMSGMWRGLTVTVTVTVLVLSRNMRKPLSPNLALA